MALCHLRLCSFLVFLLLCLSHNCVWISRPLWIAVLQVSTVLLSGTDGCTVIFFVASVKSLHLYLILPPGFYGLLSCCLHGWNSSDGSFLDHTVCPGGPFWYCYRGFQCWSGLCLQMLLTKMLHCCILHFLGMAFHPLLAEDLLWNPYPMHLFLGTVLPHFIMPWLYCFLAQLYITWA